MQLLLRVFAGSARLGPMRRYGADIDTADFSVTLMHENDRQLVFPPALRHDQTRLAFPGK